MTAPPRIYVTDCEGPLSKNDNAQELAERFIPGGAELFAEVRRRGEVREIPLLYQTLRLFADGQLATSSGAVFAESSRLPLDLTDLVEAELGRRA